MLCASDQWATGVYLQASQMKSVVVAQSGGAASQTAKPMAGKAATGL